MSNSEDLRPVACEPAPVAIADWDDLLHAVKARLRLIVGAQTPASDAAMRVQAGVLECVSALDQLHLTLSLEIGQRLQIEREIFDLRAALAQQSAELEVARGSARRVQQQCLLDELTSLPNGRHFSERLQRTVALLEPGRPALAVLCLDLDGFKPINELHGPEVGNEMLRIVAARLVHTMRSEDMVSRLGGDAFGCLLAGALEATQLGLLADKVFDAVSAPLQIGTLSLSVQPSIGMAIYPQDGPTAQALLASADTARRQAKRYRSRYAFVDRHALA